MKNSLIGALAFFAISAMGVQDAMAQNVDNKIKKEEVSSVTIEKKAEPSVTAVTQEPVKQKKEDCCVGKKDAKKGDCCIGKRAAADGKQVKAECKKECKKDNQRVDIKKAEPEK